MRAFIEKGFLPHHGEMGDCKEKGLPHRHGRIGALNKCDCPPQLGGMRDCKGRDPSLPLSLSWLPFLGNGERDLCICSLSSPQVVVGNRTLLRLRFSHDGEGALSLSWLPFLSNGEMDLCLCSLSSLQVVVGNRICLRLRFSHKEGGLFLFLTDQKMKRELFQM
jgi:hypothetical protein